jgi:GTP-binding protein HflX
MTTHPIPQSTQKSTTLKALLVGVEIGSSGSLEHSLEELDGLARTAHYQPVATFTQRLATINSKTFIGKGKVEELLTAVKHHEADAVIFDEALTPAQTRNLENILKCGIVDRPWIILEIFKSHARTREAKTQVELARLQYALPRLTKMWTHLSRQRGGIGMKDAGETQIQQPETQTHSSRTRDSKKGAPKRLSSITGRLHQCRQIHPDELPHRSRYSGG